MAITKKFLKSKPVCKVTFALSETEAKTAEVLGDFNDWGATAFALKKQKNGIFKGTFDIPANQSFEFRYKVDGEYRNDEQADAYQWNDFAGDSNGVLEL